MSPGAGLRERRNRREIINNRANSELIGGYREAWGGGGAISAFLSPELNNHTTLLRGHRPNTLTKEA